MQTVLSKAPDFQKKLAAFCAQAGAPADVVEKVADVIAQVRRGGDAALLEFTRRFDGVKMTRAQLRVPEAEIAASLKALPVKDRARIRQAIACIRDFHRRTLPKNWRAKNPQGGIVGENFYPIRRVGINVPAGHVPLVSTVLMTVLLAKLAGVKEVAVCTPPQKNGKADPGLLAGLHLCGVTEVYVMGGIQAMAAFAYGTQTVKPVDKLFGPGNMWVTEAKRQLFGTVGVDLLPGPSEVMVIADRNANPAWTAADLLAQAEHGTGREKIYLVVQGMPALKRILKEVERQQALLPPNDGRQRVWKEGCFVAVINRMEEAADIANYVAPEHLEIHVEQPRMQTWLAEHITTAGAMLLGEQTPTALGDFTAGPSHTLPTGRTGRFFSGLRIDDFMRRTSVVCYNRNALQKARDVVETFSRMEQLPAHGRSLFVRLEK